MVFLRDNKLARIVLIAALLLAEVPNPVVQAQTTPRPGTSWKPILRQQNSRTSIKYESPGSLSNPGFSAPANMTGARSFSRSYDWQTAGNALSPLGIPGKGFPEKIKAETLDGLSQQPFGPASPLYQVPLPAGSAPALLPTVTGAQPQTLIPPASSTPQAPRVMESMIVNTALKLPPEKNIRFKNLEVRDSSIVDVLRGLAQFQGIELNLMLAPDISGTISFIFNDVTAEEVFNTILRTQNLAFSWDDRILRIFTATSAPMSTYVFNIQNTSAAGIKPIIDRMLTTGRGRSEVDARLNAILVTDTPNVIDAIRVLLPQIDVRETTGEVTSRPITEVFYLDYVDATVLLSPIQIVAPTANIQSFSSSSSQAAGGGGAGRMDMMIITDTQSNLSRIRELIEKLDIEPIQVTIDAHIYEIDLNEEERLGINWQKQIPLQGTTDNSFDMTIAPEDANAGGTGVFRFGTLSVNQFRALLAMLKTHTFAKVLSNPVITTLNNRQANITVGQAIPFISASTVNAQTGQVTNTVGQANANITLVVTPSVTGNEEVFLQIAPTISSVLGFSTLGGNQTPNLSNRSANTQVIVKNNHTIVIGGMIKTDKSDTMSKVPFFGDLPGIGKLFQKKTSKEIRTELIIFITPHIVRKHANQKFVDPSFGAKNFLPKLSLQ